MSRKFILAIDSGGVQNIIPAVILVELERRLQQAGKTKGIGHYFDLVAGCGLGALMVAALTCPHPVFPWGRVATPSDLLAFFKANMPAIFSGCENNDAARGPFGADRLEQGLKSYLGSTRLLADLETYIVIPAFDLQRRAPVVLSNVEAGKDNFYLWQAVRSGCAMPGLFAPAMVENLAKARPRGTPLIPLIHGGSISDDPSLAAYVEASKLGWTGRDHDTFFLSLGTGLDRRPIDYLDASQGGNHGIALARVSPAQVNRETERDEPTPYQLNALLNHDSAAFNGTSTRMTSLNREKLRFFRINGSLQQASAGLDHVSPENMQRLEADADRIISENSALLDQIVWQLGREDRQPAGHRLHQAPYLIKAGTLADRSRVSTVAAGELYRRPAERVPA